MHTPLARPVPQPAAFDTIAFDLDGTLVDTADDLTASLNHALQMLGRRTVPEESVRHMVGHGGRRLLERGLAATGEMTAELVEEGLKHFLSYYTGHVADRSRPFPGVETALDQLAGVGWRLAVCTNKYESLAKDLIGRLGWQDRFHAIKGADSQDWHKPDPRHLQGAVAAAGGSACIFVGDSRTDADTAVAAEVPFVLVSFGYPGDALDQLPATRRIDHYDELTGAVADIQAMFTAAG